MCRAGVGDRAAAGRFRSLRVLPLDYGQGSDIAFVYLRGSGQDPSLITRRVESYEFLVPGRPVSVHTTDRKAYRAFQDRVYIKGARVWPGYLPFDDSHTRLTIVFLCEEKDQLDVDTVVKPIMDALELLYYADDDMVSDVRRAPAQLDGGQGGNRTHSRSSEERLDGTPRVRLRPHPERARTGAFSMSPGTAATPVDAVTAKVEILRERYEKEGYEVIERPGPEQFPCKIAWLDRHRPAMLARRGDERCVFEFFEAVRFTGRLADCAGELRDDPNWHFHILSCDDVVPDDAPGIQGEPPAWPELEQRATDTMRVVEPLPAWLRLPSLWTAVEAVLRRLVVDHGIPVDLLSASSLIQVVHDAGVIPFAWYEPLKEAHEIHRRVRHGFDAPDQQVAEAVSVLTRWLSSRFPASLERAA